MTGERGCARAIADLLGTSGGYEAPPSTEQQRALEALLREESPEADYEVTPESGEVVFGAPTGRRSPRAPLQLYTEEP